MLAAVLAFAGASQALGCGGATVAAGGGEAVTGFGLSVKLPSDWTGRVFRLSPRYAITLEAASTKLPPEGQVMTVDRLGARNSYVIINDFGRAPSAVVKHANGWQLHPRLPLALGRSDLRGPYEGNFPSGATLPVAIAGRALEIRIRFGSRPGDGQLSTVNRLLAGLSVDARPDSTLAGPDGADARLRRCPASAGGFSAAGWGGRVARISCGAAGQLIERHWLRDFPRPPHTSTRPAIRHSQPGSFDSAGFRCEYRPLQSGGGWRLSCSRAKALVVFRFTP